MTDSLFAPGSQVMYAHDDVEGRGLGRVVEPSADMLETARRRTTHPVVLVRWSRTSLRWEYVEDLKAA